MHPTDFHLHIGLWVIGFLTGGGSSRALIYLSKSLAPLPPNAGWWPTTLYNIVKGASGLDPNSAIISQNTLKQITGTGIPAIQPKP